MNEARAKRTSAITKGCATARPILVAVEADAHRIANNVPAINQLKFFFRCGIRFCEDIISFVSDVP